MKTFLELDELTYDGIGGFIEEAAHRGGDSSYFLGKAAAYTDIAYSLGQISEQEALELFFCVELLI